MLNRYVHFGFWLFTIKDDILVLQNRAIKSNFSNI